MTEGADPPHVRAELDRLLQQMGDPAPVNGDSDASTDLAKVFLSERYRGSFPHPSTLRDLNEVVQNGAERAFSLTEREQAHRHKTDDRLTELEVETRRAEFAERRLIIWITLIVIIAGLATSAGLAIAGLAVGAGVTGGVTTALAGLSGTLAYKRGKPDKTEK